MEGLGLVLINFPSSHTVFNSPMRYVATTPDEGAVVRCKSSDGGFRDFMVTVLILYKNGDLYRKLEENWLNFSKNQYDFAFLLFN